MNSTDPPKLKLSLSSIQNPPAPETIKVNKLALLLKKSHSVESPTSTVLAPVSVAAISTVQSQLNNLVAEVTDKYGKVISYNSNQLRAVTLASQGSSCVVIGAAGTGKTTVMKGVSSALVNQPGFPILRDIIHKHLVNDLPGIVFCAYTRRATANLRRNLSKDLQPNCITIHKLLEYEPVYSSVTDPETGDEKTVMTFEPARCASNPLPESIRTVIIEESSMVSVDLFKELQDALPHNPQFIFLGDIQQLPPVFGAAILGYKMLELPIVELTEVYRQALESPIIRLAHRILSGKPILSKEYPEWKVQGELGFTIWPKKLADDIACIEFCKSIKLVYDAGKYSPDTDIILCPFNKAFGTEEINKEVANHIARKSGKDTYEIIAGFQSYYYSVGDKILVDKEDAIVTRIEKNQAYTGKPFHPHSPTLDYWGIEHGSVSMEVEDLEDVDFLLGKMTLDSDERVKQASHTLYYKRYTEAGEIAELESKVDTASAFNAMSLGYAITVHKSQGSEWDKVFLVFHQSHATMTARELLYTAVTRAKRELYVICEPETFDKGIRSQRIKGDTLQEKIIYFQGKSDEKGGIL